MGDMHHIGGAACFRRIHITELQPHIIDHGKATKARRVACAKIAVNIVLGKAGVIQRPLGHFGMKLRQRFSICFSRRMLIGTCDISFTFYVHEKVVLFLLLSMPLQHV